jgi:uncharacterized protein (TIGR00369 family)
MSNPETRELLRKFLAYIPFNVYLGIEITELVEGQVRMRLPFRPEFVGDPSRPALHGGVLSTLLDAVGGAAVWSTVALQDRVSTIDLRIDYLLPGKLEPVIAEGRIVRAGRRVAVVAMRAFHESAPTQTISEGKGVYNIRPNPHRVAS